MYLICKAFWTASCAVHSSSCLLASQQSLTWGLSSAWSYLLGLQQRGFQSETQKWIGQWVSYFTGKFLSRSRSILWDMVQDGWEGCHKEKHENLYCATVQCFQLGPPTNLTSNFQNKHACAFCPRFYCWVFLLYLLAASIWFLFLTVAVLGNSY